MTATTIRDAIDMAAFQILCRGAYGIPDERAVEYARNYSFSSEEIRAEAIAWAEALLKTRGEAMAAVKRMIQAEMDFNADLRRRVEAGEITQEQAVAASVRAWYQLRPGALPPIDIDEME